MKDEEIRQAALNLLKVRGGTMEFYDLTAWLLVRTGSHFFTAKRVLERMEKSGEIACEEKTPEEGSRARTIVRLIT
ncbi:MAG TPA: hypothetical protein VFT82_01260 [Candidatus Paceibacterota bacterium]|nr:hypothetical protein [Candidatus Paceibacterota bacterium]